MSSSTWTPHAVASETREAAFRVWRAVEAQHVVSTMRLVGNRVAAQSVLEDILEASKPGRTDRSPLDPLLATPFRYRSALGSRFRGPADAGVFYGADEIPTACAELGYWRWRFVMASEGLRATGLAATPHTLFRAGLRATAIDLRLPPFARQRRRWTHRSDYASTEAFAVTARAAGVAVIRYESVRDPARRGCAAVLSATAFSPRRRVDEQTWHLTVTADAVAWQRDGEALELETERWR